MEIDDYELGIEDGINDEYPTETKVRIYVMDFNNRLLNGYSVPDIEVKCNKGYFNEFKYHINASQMDWGVLNELQECTVPIGYNGFVELTYVASEWGFCTITCDNIIKNVMVRGFKKVQDNPPLYVDESIRACRLYYTLPSVEMTGSQKTLLTGAVPTKYCPNSTCYFNGYRDDLGLSLTYDGNIRGRRGTGDNFTPSNIEHIFEWRY